MMTAETATSPDSSGRNRPLQPRAGERRNQAELAAHIDRIIPRNPEDPTDYPDISFSKELFYKVDAKAGSHYSFPSTIKDCAHRLWVGNEIWSLSDGEGDSIDTILDQQGATLQHAADRVAEIVAAKPSWATADFERHLKTCYVNFHYICRARLEQLHANMMKQQLKAGKPDGALQRADGQVSSTSGRKPKGFAGWVIVPGARQWVSTERCVEGSIYNDAQWYEYTNRHPCPSVLNSQIRAIYARLTAEEQLDVFKTLVDTTCDSHEELHPGWEQSWKQEYWAEQDARIIKANKDLDPKATGNSAALERYKHGRSKAELRKIQQEFEREREEVREKKMQFVYARRCEVLPEMRKYFNTALQAFQGHSENPSDVEFPVETNNIFNAFDRQRSPQIGRGLRRSSRSTDRTHNLPSRRRRRSESTVISHEEEVDHNADRPSPAKKARNDASPGNVSGDSEDDRYSIDSDQDQDQASLPLAYQGSLRRSPRKISSSTAPRPDDRAPIWSNLRMTKKNVALRRQAGRRVITEHTGRDGFEEVVTGQAKDPSSEGVDDGEIGADGRPGDAGDTGEITGGAVPSTDEDAEFVQEFVSIARNA